MVATASVDNVAAQKFELGVRAGVASQNLDMKFDGLQDAKARLGWHLAAVSRIRIVGFGDGFLGAGLFFQPELVYSQNNYKMSVAIPGMGNASLKTRMKTVDVPLLLSLKVSVARVQAGPVFNLMNNMTSVGGDLKWNARRSPVGYALGASVDLGALVIDGRYHGEFKKLESNIDSGSNLHQSVKNSLSSWSIGVGLMF